MSELLLVGMSHKTAPVALRERVALTDAEAAALCAELCATHVIDEAVVLSTCNRTEVVVTVSDPVAAEGEVLTRLARHAGIGPTELAEAIYATRNCDAARHVFAVTSGLDSMVVGEAEIQGQVRRAVEAARAAGTSGPLSNRLFEAALRTGGRVRAETAVGEGRTSVASVAVDLAREAVGDLTRRTVVVIGAGETAELVARALAAQGVHTVFVANRHADRARSIAERIGGHVSSLHELPERIAEADVVVSSTASPHPLITADALAEVVLDRDRPLVLIDIAVPRDVEPLCRQLPNVRLYDIDDLQAVVSSSHALREAERAQAEALVEDEIQRFARWMGQLDVLPTIGALREHGSAIVDQVLAENAGRWEGATPRDRARVDAMVRAVAQRLLHEPTIRLRSLHEDAAHGRLEVVRELFGLHDQQGEADEPQAPGEVRPLRRSADRR